MYRYANTVNYGLIGYFIGVSGSAIITKLTENKYEKHYQTVSYKKTFYSPLSLFGLCVGSYIGYNKQIIRIVLNILRHKI